MDYLTRDSRIRIGIRIRAARKQAGLSHDRLGALVGTSRQHLIKLEKGQHAPREETLRRIAVATGKSVSFFLADENDEEDEAEPVALLIQAIRALVRDEVRAQPAASRSVGGAGDTGEGV
jgi:transcriptional regulator with XRE-family HTH domain